MTFKTKPKAKPHSTPLVINRDGTLNVVRPKEKGRLFTDLYHYLLSIPWPKFFLIIFLLVLCSNLFFACIYYLAGPQAFEGMHPSGIEHFIDCFFFSVHSLSGPYVPVGPWLYVLVTFQSYMGMLAIVLVTGLFYARFARPYARVIFSDNALINQYNGRPCFVFRVANERLNQIIEAKMILTLTKNQTSPEGETSRKFFDMPLEFDYSPVFALSWTIRHYIDEKSPLHGMDEEQMKKEQVVIFASLSGLDDTFSQTVTARTVYRFDEILHDKRFKDILLWENGKMHIDLQGIHDVH